MELLQPSFELLPENIHAAVGQFEAEPAQLKDRRKQEKSASRKLLINLLESRNIQNGVLKYEVSGQPWVHHGQERIHVSLSHSRGKFGAVFSQTFQVGIDIEKLDRRIRPELINRILHPFDDLPEDWSVIEIWSAKEAVLKCKGTGLRFAMNKISVTKTDKGLIVANDGQQEFRIYQTRMDGYTIAIAASGL